MSKPIKEMRETAGRFIKANPWRFAAIIEGVVIVILLAAAQ